MWHLNKDWPTRWHLLYYLLLNMFQTLIRPSSGASEYLLRCVGWLEACWCYVAGLSVGDVVSECRLWFSLHSDTTSPTANPFIQISGWTSSSSACIRIPHHQQPIPLFKYQAEPSVVVQPALGYHITNRQSRYITPARLKSAYTTQQVLANSWSWTY